jgi:arylsulfatase A-like enzyme/tetratricopeptide (TPR) repeat protein
MYRWLAAGFLAALLPAGLLRGEEPRSVVLVTLDTVRADRLGCYGYRAAVTPVLDRFAREGVRFERATSSSPLTLPAHASMFTGRCPTAHRLRRMETDRIPADMPTLAELFRGSGYATVAVTAAGILSPAAGFARGFDRFDGATGLSHESRPASEVTDRALAALAGRSGPTFAWIHYYDAHFPWEPPTSFRNRFSHPYDGEIAVMDSEIGRLVRELTSRKVFRNALFVFVGDHGESLGEHDETEHGLLLTEGVLHVPWVFWTPDGSLAPRTIPERVSTTSIAPTVAELAGIRGKLPPWDVPSLAAVVRGRARPPAAPLYAETFHPLYTFRWSAVRAVTEGRWRLVESSEIELYDLESDPGETRNVATANTAVVGRLRRLFAGFSNETWGRLDADAGAAAPDPEQVARLRSLGYISGEPPPPAGTDFTRLPNPRGRAGVASDIIARGFLLQRDQKWGELADLMRAALRREPSSVLATARLAGAEAGLKHWESAEALWRQVEKSGATVEALSNLALCRYNRGDLRGAIPLLERANALDRRDPVVIARLMYFYNRADRRDAARALWERVRRDGPRTPEISFQAGLLSMGDGDAAAARALFLEAAKGDPSNADARANLAALAMNRGDVDEAILEIRQAIKIDAKAPTYRLLLVDALVKTDRRAEAAEAASAYVRDFPTGPDVTRMKELLKGMKR